MPQNGVITGRHTETLHQPLTRPAAGDVTKQLNKVTDSQGPTRITGGDSR